MAKILISGGSGLVGQELTRVLLEAGHHVAWLSRTAGTRNGVKSYSWDPVAGTMDPRALYDADHVVHLAGAGIVGKRWSKRYKAKILSSRVAGSELLYRQMVVSGVKLRSFTGAGAVGYYGARIDDTVHTENERAGSDFLARVCVAWEKSYEPFRHAGVRTCVIRSGVALSEKGGALRKMLPFFRAGLGAAVAPGIQAFPWIHVSDLANVYRKSIEDETMSGAFNAVAPHHVNNREFSFTLAGTLHKRLWLPPVPEGLLRMGLGEASSTLTTGLRVSPGKLEESGFHFAYPELQMALDDLVR